MKFWTLEACSGGSTASDKRLSSKELKDKLSWKLTCGTPARSRLCDFDQNFTCMAFIDDSEPIRHFDQRIGRYVYFPNGDVCRNEEKLGIWMGKESRVLVGTANGDVYVFYQPRRNVQQDNTNSYQCQPWWELDVEGPRNSSKYEESDERILAMKWHATAKLVYVLPRSIEEGNRRLLNTEQQKQLKQVRLDLKRMKTREGSPTRSPSQHIDHLLSRESSLLYPGPIGHDGCVSSLAVQQDEQEVRVISVGGSTMELRIWQIIMHKRPQIKGVHGAADSSPGSHEFNIIKKKRLTCSSATNMSWRGDRIMLKTDDGISCISSDTLEVQPIYESPHRGIIHAVRLHHSLPIFATTDKHALAIWSLKSDHEQHRQYRCLAKYLFSKCEPFSGGGCCLDWYPSNEETILAVGTANAGLVWIKFDQDKSSFESRCTFVADNHAASASVQSPTKIAAERDQTKLNEWLCLRYSPDGKMLAGACRREKHIRLYSVSSTSGRFTRLGSLKGHTSPVRSIDWSVDGRFIQSNDFARELCYWDAKSCNLIRKPIELRDVKWASWSCRVGWPVSGLRDINIDILALARSNSAHLGIMSYENSSVRHALQFFSWPVLSHKARFGFKIFYGHDKKISQLEWSPNDSFVYSSAGGSLFEWSIIYMNKEVIEKAGDISRVAKEEQILIAKPYKSVLIPDSKRSKLTKPRPKQADLESKLHRLDHNAPREKNRDKISNDKREREILADVMDSLILVIEVEQSRKQKRKQTTIPVRVHGGPIRDTVPQSNENINEGISFRNANEFREETVANIPADETQKKDIDVEGRKTKSLGAAKQVDTSENMNVVDDLSNIDKTKSDGSPPDGNRASVVVKGYHRKDQSTKLDAERVGDAVEYIQNANESGKEDYHEVVNTVDANGNRIFFESTIKDATKSEESLSERNGEIDLNMEDPNGHKRQANKSCDTAFFHDEEEHEKQGINGDTKQNTTISTIKINQGGKNQTLVHSDDQEKQDYESRIRIQETLNEKREDGEPSPAKGETVTDTQNLSINGIKEAENDSPVFAGGRNNHEQQPPDLLDCPDGISQEKNERQNNINIQRGSVDAQFDIMLGHNKRTVSSKDYSRVEE